MDKSLVLYADGSTKRGYGHLYRLYGIWSNFFGNQRYKFLYKNNLQKTFYEDMGVIHQSFKKTDFKENSYTLIADTKEININYLERLILGSKRSIIIDSYHNWVNKFDICVIPSFYYDKNRITAMRKKLSVLAGTKYTVIRNKSSKKSNNKIDLLVTFGGSDPNDITSKILLYLTKSKIKQNVSVIIGPGFKKSLNIFQTEFPNFSFIFKPNNTFEYVKISTAVITALGTTIQEIEYLEKKGIICFNYENDQKDFNLLKSFSENKDRWFSLGHHSDLNFNNLETFLNKKVSLDLNVEKSWGNGWRNISTE